MDTSEILGLKKLFPVTSWKIIGIKLHNLQYDEGGNHMAETETETSIFLLYDRNNFFELL
jgi:hypothetical protein